jgi:molybdopterin-binding protein
LIDATFAYRQILRRLTEHGKAPRPRTAITSRFQPDVAKHVEKARAVICDLAPRGTTLAGERRRTWPNRRSPHLTNHENQCKGKITDIKPVTTSHVSIDIGQGSMLTASITNEAVADLGLKVGDDAWAIIKPPTCWSPNNQSLALRFGWARDPGQRQPPIHLKPAWRNYFASAQSVVAVLRPLSPIATDFHHRSSAARRQGRRTLIPAEYLIHPANLCSGTATSTGMSASAAC